MRRALLLAAAALLVPAAAAAHHGWAGQETDKVTTLEGTIEAVRYQDPHAEIELTDHGRKWLVTLAPVLRMESRGVSKDKLTVGRKVKVEGRRNLKPDVYEVKAMSISLDGAPAANMMR